MAHNLLEVVQRVLEKLNLEDVNSINDSSESLLISREAENTFFDLLSRDYWPHTQSVIELESVGDSSTPNLLRLPDNVLKIEDIRYDITDLDDDSKTMKTIKYLNHSEFLDYIYRRNTNNDNVIEITYNNIPLYIVTDDAPTYWTTFDDEFVVFDSYDSNTESTLNGNKSVTVGFSVPTWQQIDTYVIDIPEKWFPFYLAEVSSACSVYLNQEVSPVDVQRASRAISRMRREANRLVTQDNKVKFGREGNGVR